MARIIEFEKGEFYHIYNRGVDKRTIFEDEADRWWFMHLLYHCNTSTPLLREMIDLATDLALPKKDSYAEIAAYCLMPNHFHLLLREPSGTGITSFMHKLGTAYTKYFNMKYDRTGSLLEGTFKAKYIDTDEYLKHTFGYIALNPAKLADSLWKERRGGSQETLAFVKEYPFSSTKEYLGSRKKYAPIIKPECLPFENRDTRMDNLLSWWLEYREPIKH